MQVRNIVRFAARIRRHAAEYNAAQIARPFQGNPIDPWVLSSSLIKLPSQSNALGHTWAAAVAAYEFGPGTAMMMAIGNEWVLELGSNLRNQSNDNPFDEYSDHWNNNVGIQIGVWVRDQGLPVHAIDFIVRYAFEKGALTAVTHNFDGDRVVGWSRIPGDAGETFLDISEELMIEAVTSDEYFDFIADVTTGDYLDEGESFASILEEETFPGKATKSYSELVEFEEKRLDIWGNAGATLGRILGSQLGSLIAGDEPALNFVSSTVFGAIGGRLGQAIALSAATATPDLAEQLQAALDDIFALDLDLKAAFAGAAIGTVSSFLSVEFADALGIDGDIAEVFGRTASSALQVVLENAANGSANLLSGFTTIEDFFQTGTEGVAAGPGALMANALGAFLGAKLGSLVVQPETQAAAVLSSIGTVAGAWAFSTASGFGWGAALFNTSVTAASTSASSWWALNFVAPGIGAFIGFVLGAFIGNLFGRKKPKVPTANAEVGLQIPLAHYELGAVTQANGGNLNLARSMGLAARDTLNGLIGVITRDDPDARVSNTTALPQKYGHTGNQLWVQYDVNFNGALASNEKVNVDSADEAVDKGVLWAIPNTRIVGGDLFLKRALYNMTRHPGQVTSVAQLAGDLQIADDYAFYLQNRAIIDAVIAEPWTSMSAAQQDFYTNNKAFMTRALAKAQIPLSGADLTFYNANQTMVESIVNDLQLTQFAAAWIVTLQRAAELELNRAAPSDFYGGAKGFADSLMLHAGASDLVTYEAVTFETVGAINEFRGAELDQGVGMFADGSQSSPGPFVRTIETFEGDKTLVAKKSWTAGQGSFDGNWTTAGSLRLYAGDTAQGGYWVVTPGERVGVAMDVKGLDATTEVQVQIRFFDATGANIANSNAPYTNVVDWAHYQILADAPANAVKARVDITVRAAGDQRNNPHQGVAIRNPQFNRLSTNESVVPPYEAPWANGGPSYPGLLARLDLDGADAAGSAANQMRGSEWEYGTASIRNFSVAGAGTADPDTGATLVFNIEPVDGAAALVMRRPSPSSLSSSKAFSGTAILYGGDRTDGRWTVSPGQRIGFAIEAKLLENTTSVAVRLRYLDAAGAWLSYSSSVTYASADEWGRIEGTAIAPANAASFAVEVYAYGGPNLGEPLSAALRKPQVHYLGSSEPVPAYVPHAASDDYAFLIPNMGDAALLPRALGENTVGNDVTILSNATGPITIQDYRTTWVTEWIDPDPYVIGDEYEDTYQVTLTGGDDIFVTGAGADTLKGYAGDDWLDGNAGDDQAWGGEGNDVLLGREGNDTLRGEGGDDVLMAGAGTDTVYGDAGADRLDLGTGVLYYTSKYAYGGDDDDIFYADRTGSTIDGGAGSDTLSYIRQASALTTTMPAAFNAWRPDGPNGINYSLENNDGSNITDDDTVTSVENVEGTNFNDYIEGSAVANTLNGGGGDDWLDGRSGDDILEGGPGADKLADTVGETTASYRASAFAVWVDMTAQEYFGGDAEGDEYAGVDHVIGSRFADTIKGDTGGNHLTGLEGDDWFIATLGGDLHNGGEGFDTVDYADMTSAATVNLTLNNGSGSAAGHTFASIEHIVGSEFADTITLTSGDDTVTGGKGNDAIAGNAGSDTYVFYAGDGLDTVTETTDGANAVVFGDGTTWTQFSFSTSGSTLNLRLSATDYVSVGLNFSSNNNKIKSVDMAGAGAVDVAVVNWTFDGNDTAQTINGSGKDWILAHGGDDIVYGKTSNAWEQDPNIIAGGLGNDTIYTSVGDDQFVFERGHGRDVLTDTGGDDTIIFGPTVAAEDVIFKVVGNDLYIGARDLDDPELAANEVDDYIKVVGGGLATHDLGTGETSYNTIEFVRAGGAEINLLKLDVDWTVQNVGGGGGGGGGGPLPPVVFDLGGDGLDLIGVDQSKVVLNSGEGKTLYRTGWVGQQDAMLAIDRNDDGAITSLSEISFVGEKEGARTDLEGLAGLDSNGDGVLNAKDEQWSALKLWRDVNENGRGFGKEVMNLEDAGIVEISLSLAATGFTPQNGVDNVALNTATFVWADGRTGTVYDVMLATKLAHIKGFAYGSGDKVWTPISKDAELGRAEAVDGKSDGQASVAFGQEAPAQNLVFVRDDLRDGLEDLPEIVPDKRNIADLTAAGETPPTDPSAGGVAPIVIDLDGNGLSLIDALASNVSFDIDRDGWSDKIGWVGAGDALLALDRDGDGLVLPVSEISFVGDAADAQTDLEGLKAFDSDQDGALTSSDARFGDFLLWRDLNQDGRSSLDEVQTLADAGLVSLEFNVAPVTPVAAGTSNVTLRTVTATFDGGVAHTAGDVVLGSRSGLYLALEETSELSLPALGIQFNNYAPGGVWNLGPDTRRILMSGALPDAPLPTQFASAAPFVAPLDVSSAAHNGAGLPAEAPRKVRSYAPEWWVVRDDVRDADGSLAPSLVTSAEEASPRTNLHRRVTRRWWTIAGQQPATAPAGLQALLDRMEAQSIAARAPIGLGEDRAISAPLAQRTNGFIQAMAALAPKSGGEARLAAKHELGNEDVALPTRWRRERMRA